jgi:hypothetical protein
MKQVTSSALLATCLMLVSCLAYSYLKCFFLMLKMLLYEGANEMKP